MVEEWFIVERNGRTSGKLASRADVENFLNDCGIEADSQNWYAAFAGVPIDVDGGQVRFTKKSEKNPSQH
jgi:hypothetical protein